MSNHENEPGHGNSIAAWTAVIVAIFGVSVTTLGFMISDSLLITIGSVVTVISIPLGPILVKLGLGLDRGNTAKK